ncbi:MAG: response regulator transcription factor [gamma proteobacterium symbiont of Taylorina sp.]|nr:response regulator transcription factor [gamma proteobacterium symbiont of Taylorina sp.]
MNTFICSTNKEITNRLQTILSDHNIDSQIFTSFNDLRSALQKSSIINLIYHLDSDFNNEAEIEAIQAQFKEKINTLALSNMPNSEQGVRLLNNNIRGYANSWIEPDKLIVALSVIEQGEIWAGAILIEYLLSKSTEQNNSAQTEQAIDQFILDQLSGREQQIVQHIFSGQQNKLIADDLGISERTVKAHLTTIYKKLKVRNRLELSLKLSKKTH